MISLSLIEVSDSGRPVTSVEWEIASFISVQHLSPLSVCVWCLQGPTGLFTSSGKAVHLKEDARQSFAGVWPLLPFSTLTHKL